MSMPEKISIDEIDIELAASDPNYRRQVLDLLNAASADGKTPTTDQSVSPVKVEAAGFKKVADKD